VLRLAIALAAAALAGSAAPPKTALLTHVQAEPGRVTFSFLSAPRQVKAGWVPRSKVTEDGSGKHVQVAGAAVLVLRFVPASGADLSGNTFRLVYKGPKRLKPQTRGPVREVVRVGDFEAMLSWAIGLDRKRQYRIVRNGANVVVMFR
jgi:hypothetical protein